MSEQSKNPITEADQQITLKLRQQFWIDLDKDAFDALCVKQKLVSQGLTNKCLDSAANLYSIVRDPRTAYEPAFKSFLDCLDDLRRTQIVVSAATFLEARRLGIARDVPRGQSSELIDFVEFNRRLSMEVGLKKFREICERCHDAALDGDPTRSAEWASLASRYVSELDSVFADIDESFRQELLKETDIISDTCRDTCRRLSLIHGDENDDHLLWRLDARYSIASNLGPLISEIQRTALPEESQETQNPGSD